MRKLVNKKGQMTIFVIIAIVIVAILIILFVFRKNVEKPIDFNEGSNSVPFVEGCARDSAKEALDLMLPQGGFVNPKNYISYNHINITYLCENVGYFEPCVNQHPVFLNEIRDEIYDYSYNDIDECFLSFKDEMESKNKQVEIGEMNLSYELAPNRVKIKIDRNMKITDGDKISNLNNFEVEIMHPVYELANVANEIASQEAKYCYFEYVGYMLTYPQFTIAENTLSDSTKIYSIKDNKSGKELNIATRGCAIPAGI